MSLFMPIRLLVDPVYKARLDLESECLYDWYCFCMLPIDETTKIIWAMMEVGA